MTTKTCDACNAAAPATQQSGNFIDYGWSFHWPDMGHYGGFTDHFLDTPEDVAASMVHLCHDCCVKMLAMFPALVNKMGVRGGHPNMNEHDSDNGIATPPCCPYAWTWVRDRSEPDYQKQFTTYFATAELTWEKVEKSDDVHVEWTEDEYL